MAATGATRIGPAGFDANAALLAPPSLLVNGFERAAAAATLGCALCGSLGPGGPIPSVVARAALAIAETRGSDSSMRSASETRTGSSDSKRGKASSGGAAGFENGFGERGLVGSSLPNGLWLRPAMVGAGMEFCFGIDRNTSAATASTPMRFWSAL
jgi:hypothetical protein